MNRVRLIKIFTFLSGFILWPVLLALSQSEPQNYEQVKAEYEKLKKEYENVVHDRDNLRTQATILLKYKNEITQAQEQTRLIEQERNQWEIERQVLKNQIQKLQGEIEQHEIQLQGVEVVQLQLEEEKDQIKKSLLKSKAGYIIVDDLKMKLNDQKKEKFALDKKIKRLESECEAVENKLIKSQTETNILREQLKEVKEKYSGSLRQNEILAKKIEQQPKEYVEIARENKILIKRTALMHYNLGVFYTKNKEYARATAEFEKTIELNPEDAYAYFNLGYIYAEYFTDRPKAIEYFKKYLNQAKKDDKDVDWVKKYILTWQTWEGKNAAR